MQTEREGGEASDRAWRSVSDCVVRSSRTSQNIIKERPFVWLSPCWLVETADCFTQATDTRASGGVAVLSWEYPVASDAAAPRALFDSSRSVLSNRSHDVSVESRSACRETPF